MARSAHIPARPFDFQFKQPDTCKQPVHHQGFSWSPGEGLNIQLRPSASYFRHSATTFHLWERWEGDNMLPRMKRVKDCESFKASAPRKRSLKTSWPPAFITHYSLSFIPTGKSSSDIKHPYILGRHTKKSTLPCPEIAAFFLLWSYKPLFFKPDLPSKQLYFQSRWDVGLNYWLTPLWSTQDQESCWKFRELSSVCSSARKMQLKFR